MKNKGKVFEDDFKLSVPDYCFVHRLRDSAQSFKKSKTTKFSWDNECDFFVFNSKSKNLYTLELKSTKYKSMSWQEDKNDDSSKMIKYHQIKSLSEMSNFDGIISGFIFNFRDEKNNMERTYFQRIDDFIKMKSTINKKSCDEMDILLNGGIKINGAKKRTHYRWDINEFMSNI